VQFLAGKAESKSGGSMKKPLRSSGRKHPRANDRNSGKPILHRKMPFGKHQGSGMEAVPMDYLQWLSRTVLDEDHEIHRAALPLGQGL